MPEDRQRDAELLEAWRGGDVEAGEALFDRHAATVARFFDNKLRGGADDLIQQTFLRLVESRDRIREGVAFRGFMLGIARNVLREHVRQLARGREIDPEVESMAELLPGPSTVVARRREHRLLLEALRRVPLEHQIALELYYWEGIPAREIAAILGVPYPTMRSRMIRARELLHEAMTGLAESPDLLESTVRGLDGWAEQIREQLAAGPR